jgi:D-alanine-D-alanine ligase-like ATP-grasp enzyme
MDTRAVLEPFQEGREFTIIMIENRFGQPVALLPTEIETDYTEHQLFDFRKKYLPTRQVSYHCPPRFADDVVERIQLQAEQLWSLFGMHDFARFDGWVRADGSIYFSDFNPLSGMEQNSFLFQQAARIGLSHQAVLEAILARSCDRQGIRHALPTQRSATDSDTRTPLAILMGGATSERQVSLMSGTNVWLKLRRSSRFRPTPYLVDTDDGIWRVPYQLLLNHTVEEISTNCRTAVADEARVARFERVARERLGGLPAPDTAEFGLPERLTMKDVLGQYQHVFIGLHGGMGEDGRLQAALEARGVTFNGSGADASRLAMNKQATAEAIVALKVPRVGSIVGTSVPLKELTAERAKLVDQWRRLVTAVSGRTMIAKPMADGSSSGVVLLRSADDLAIYVTLLKDGAAQIPTGTFRDQAGPIELPLTPPEMIRFERFIRSDRIRAIGHQLRRTKKRGFIEVTLGVIEVDDRLHALQPSLTVAEGTVLSVEEKFQGGTGVNLTPPPPTILPVRIRRHLQRSLATVAARLGIRGYCRIDAFVHTTTGQILVIEINSLPALTPSTVLFQQALADEHSRSPRELIELIADNKQSG